MAPPLAIHTVRDTGPTDGGGDDTLYVVELADEGGSPETFRFTVAGTYGRPSEAELRGLIESRASGFRNDRGAVEQFRALEFEHPEGSDRRAIVLRPSPP